VRAGVLRHRLHFILFHDSVSAILMEVRRLRSRRYVEVKLKILHLQFFCYQISSKYYGWAKYVWISPSRTYISSVTLPVRGYFERRRNAERMQ